MVSKKSTILFLPGELNRVRKITVSRGLIFTLLFLTFMMIFSISWLIYDYGKIKLQIPELTYLKKENKFQKIHILALSKKINKVHQDMTRLQEFDRKLRVITNLEPFQDQDQLLALGGSKISALKSDYQLKEVHKGVVNQMHQSLKDIETKIAITSISQKELNDFFKEQKSILACTPSIKPTDGWYSSGFGYRISPFTNQKELHEGLDIATRIGTSVISPADGLVVDVGRNGSFGKMIVINHGYHIKTRYGHLNKYRIKKGEHVKRGQIIGEVGDSGRSTDPHLHYEILLDGVPVDPLRYILN